MVQLMRTNLGHSYKQIKYLGKDEVVYILSKNTLNMHTNTS